MVALTLPIVSLICSNMSASTKGSRLGMVDPAGARGAPAVPVLTARNEPPTSPSVWIAATESVRTS